MPINKPKKTSTKPTAVSKKTKDKTYGIVSRIPAIAKYHNISLSEFERVCSIASGTLAGVKFRQKNSDNVDLLIEDVAKILNTYASINARWLITGKGNMLEQNTFLNVAQVTDADKALFSALLSSFHERIRHQSAFNEVLLYETTRLVNTINSHKQ